MLKELLAVGVMASVITGGCGGYSGEPGPTPVLSVELELGEDRLLAINGHCGYEWLSVRINGQTWRAAEDWPSGGEVVEFEVELVDTETLLLSVPGEGLSYHYHYQPRPDRPLCE